MTEEKEQFIKEEWIENSKVVSTSIAWMYHGGNNNKMAIEFSSGSIYVYENITPDLYNKILDAESVGKAFHRLIRSKPEAHPFTQVLEAGES